ncbi:hypothetical protein JCM3770_003791 [Rhodotorula araucariae]
MPLDSVAPIKPPAAAQPTQGRRGGRQREQQDLNHLLGFTLPPRAPPPPPTHLPRRSTRRPSHSGGHGTAEHTRARFVHQFRFVVSPAKDYTAHFADPDIHLEWGDILQVILPTGRGALHAVTTGRLDQGGEGGKPACPICLSEPTAARMTKCGHVFCYPCVLHYLALAEPGHKSRKCPVCHDFIHAKDLKSVKWYNPVDSSAKATSLLSPSTSPPPSEPVDADLARALELSRLDAAPSTSSSAPAPPVRETLRMRLIRRPQITTLALPRSCSWPSQAVPPLRAPWQFTPDALAYAKFMLGAPEYVRDELLAQRAELDRELALLRRLRGRAGPGAGDDELGIVFVEEALRKVDEQLAECELLKTTAVMTARKRALRELQAVEDRAGAGAKPDLPPVTDTSASEDDGAGDGHGTVPGNGRPPQSPAPVVHDPIPLDFLHTRGGGGSGSSSAGGLSSAATPFVPGATTSSLGPAAMSPPPPHKSPYQRRSVLPPPAEADDPAYYFYQAASGQPIFLQPLDIRILKAHYGTYAAMPDELLVPIEGADEGSMNGELRRRCKWLAHLPLASDVVFVEADLGGLVARKALEPFQTALKQRRTKRRDRARKEDRAKQRAEDKAREAALPAFGDMYGAGAYAYAGAAGGDGLPWGLAAAQSSSWDDVHAFPAPPNAAATTTTTTNAVRTQPAAAAAPSSSASFRARPSFASALHASSRPGAYAGDGGAGAGRSGAWDDAFDDRWGEFEEQLGRQRVAASAYSHSHSPSPGAGAAAAGRNVNVGEGGVQGKKGKGKGGGGRKGKVTLSLTAGR